MATSGNYLHKEGKTAVEKQSRTESNEEKTEPGNLSLDQLESGIGKLSIKDSLPPERKDIRFRFLINVPVGVTSEMSASPESQCQRFLDLLENTAFREEDRFRFEDIAVVFGLNGKESDKDQLTAEWRKPVSSVKITFETFMFTWTDKKGQKEIPYREIREKIKKNETTKNFIKNFRANDSDLKIYFCFFDADTVDFNQVLSTYVDVVKEHNYPTVMSTGYLFPENSDSRIESERDRQMRIVTAEHFPLGTYYPEPNFCVLLPDNCDTLPESFLEEGTTHNNMESSVLLRQVKKREVFSSVFVDGQPVITPVSKKKQFHTNPWTWATGAYAHRELEVTEEYKKKMVEDYEKNKCKANGIYKSLLMHLLKSDEEALDIEDNRPFTGPGAQKVYLAARAVREYKKQEEPET